MSFGKIIVSSCAFLALATCLQAKEKALVDLKQIKHPVKPMLWKIEGKGLKKPSYLFGTIHITDSRATTLHPLAQQAFDQAGAVYTEIDLSPAKQLKMAAMYMRKDDKSLVQLVGQDMVKALNEELKAINPALNDQPFQKMKLWALALSLSQIGDQLKGGQPLDMQLWQRAHKAGKKTGALETPQGQAGQLDKFTIDEQKELLSVTLKMMKLSRQKKVKLYQEMVDAYLAGDKEAIEKQFDKSAYMGIKINEELNKKFLNLLLHQRNKEMAKSIQKALSQPDAGSFFFAAGTAHYLGKQSVNDLLKEAGYTVTPVQ